MTRISQILSEYRGSIAAFLTGGALLLALHTRGHLIEPVFLRYLLVWVPVGLLVWWLARKNPLPNTQFTEKTATTKRGPPLPGRNVWRDALRRVRQSFESDPAQPWPCDARGWPAAILVVFMILYFFSSSADYPWFYFITWLPRPVFNLGLVHSQLIQFILLTALLAPLLIRGSGKIGWWLLGVLLAAMGASAWMFIRNTGGGFLYYDDHPSFLFRLWEFCATFPRPLNYNPYWNGGEISNHPVMSGTAAFGVFLLPFWKFIPIEQLYTPLIAVVFIGLVPLMAVFSLRIAGANWTASLCAGLPALAISQLYFLWLMFYGTVGAGFAAACLMPVSACLYRVIVLDRREIWVGFILVISASLMLAWPPNVFLAFALLIAVLFNLDRLTKASVYFLLICAVAVFLVMSPAVFAIITELLRDFYRPPGAPDPVGLGTFGEIFSRGWGKLLDYIRMGHPLVIFLGLGGAVAAVSAALRRFFLPLIAALLLIVGWGPEFMPGLQLFRLAIPLFFAALIPAAIASGDLLGSSDCRPATRLPSVSHGGAFLRAAVIAILVVGAANAALMFGNNLRAPYEVLSADGYAIAAQLRSNAPEGTRVLFAGSTVHGYEGGHVAFLPYLAGREMMACDYYHFSPAAVEYDYPPQPWRKTPEMFNRYLELYNVSIVSTLRPNWTAFLRSRPQDYIELPCFGEKRDLTFFRVARAPNSAFLSGKGKVQAHFNRLEVDLEETAGPAVIKYNWHPGLAAAPPAEIFPHNAGAGLRFIGIKPNGQKKIVIRY